MPKLFNQLMLKLRTLRFKLRKPAAEPSMRRPLPTARFDSYAGFAVYRDSMGEEYRHHRDAELACVTSGTSFETSGYCYVCAAPSTFVTDYLYADGDDWKGVRMPNWRERVTCLGCGLNNRLRACIHFLEQNLGCHKGASIYLSEQTTPLYRYLHQHYPHLTGSEYFGDTLPWGAIDPATGYRNESVTQLTFATASLDFMLSFEIFEHVPDYTSALCEAARCLKPGGKLLFTVPFDLNAPHTQKRAQLDADGNIEHLVLPPIYHGDPINQNGILCFYTFGWDLLEQLKASGFTSAEAHLFWNLDYANPGHQLLLSAVR